MKGKYGSICDRKSVRHSSACRGDGSDADGEDWNGESKSVRACTREDGSVVGVGTPLMLGLLLVEFVGVSLGTDVNNGILSSFRRRRVSGEAPEELTMDCIADNMISILPSSWAIRVTDSSAL